MQDIIKYEKDDNDQLLFSFYHTNLFQEQRMFWNKYGSKHYESSVFLFAGKYDTVLRLPNLL